MSIWDLLFPKRCLGCYRVGAYVCGACRHGVRLVLPAEAICPVCERPAIGGATHPRCRSRYSPDGLTSFFHYHGIIRAAVKALKYRAVTDVAYEFVALVPESLLRELRTKRPEGIVVVPVALHRARKLERGFNQAEVLGRFLIQRLNMPLRADMLVRTRKTVPQVEMKDRQKRLGNMQNAFAVPKGSDLPANILLLDDVFTTGATMRACANVLKRNGVKSVWAVTMAR